MATGVLDPLVQEAYEKLYEIQRRVDEFFDQVNGALSWVPSFLSYLIEPIKAAIDVLNTKLDEFWERANQLRRQPGSPSRLHTVAAQWTNQVAASLADIGCTIAPDQLRTSIEWSGRAADAYAATVPAQVSGLTAAKDIAIQMQSSLDNLANSVETFWLTIKIAFVTFIVGAITAIVAAATVVGLPTAITALATAVEVSIGVIAAAVIAVTGHVNAIEAEQAAITQKIIDLGTRWSTSDIGTMSDASVADGDASNWRVKR